MSAATIPAPTIPERLAVLLAREFANGEVGFTGLATGRAAAVYITGIPLAAMALAQRRHQAVRLPALGTQAVGGAAG